MFETAQPSQVISVLGRQRSSMKARDDHIARLFTAELQFRLASAVRLATTMNIQPLDLPMDWTHGQHHVKYGGIALRPDQADYAACFLQRSATFLMAVAMKDAIVAVVPDPKTCADAGVRSAYQVSRLIRNAFAHAPFSPRWSVDPDCRENVFEVPEVLKLDTTGLHDAPVEWRHYVWATRSATPLPLRSNRDPKGRPIAPESRPDLRCHYLPDRRSHPDEGTDSGGCRAPRDRENPRWKHSPPGGGYVMRRKD